MPHGELLLRCLIQCAHNCESKLWPALYMLMRTSYPRLLGSVTEGLQFRKQRTLRTMYAINH